MAVRITSTGTQYFSRTTNLPTFSAFTYLAWIYLITDTNYYQNFFSYTGGSFGFYVGTSETGTTYFIHNPTGENAQGSELALTTWYHIGFVVLGTGAGQMLGYLNGVLNITGNSATGSGSQIRLANTSWDGDPPDMRMAAVKIYSAGLTASEIQDEVQYFRPVRTTNLNTWLPCVHPTAANNANDWSGNGYHMTVTGSPTVEDGPPISWAPRRRGPGKKSVVAIGAQQFMVATQQLTRSGGMIGRRYV